MKEAPRLSETQGHKCVLDDPPCRRKRPPPMEVETAAPGGGVCHLVGGSDRLRSIIKISLENRASRYHLVSNGINFGREEALRHHVERDGLLPLHRALRVSHDRRHLANRQVVNVEALQDAPPPVPWVLRVERVAVEPRPCHLLRDNRLPVEHVGDAREVSARARVRHPVGPLAKRHEPRLVLRLAAHVGLDGYEPFLRRHSSTTLAPQREQNGSSMSDCPSGE